MIALLALLLASPSGAVSQNPLTFAAGYYFDRGSYERALPLWRSLLQQEPANLAILFRVAELQLFLEGRTGVVPLFQTVYSEATPANRLLLRTRLQEIQSWFLSDRAQNAFLQAKQRASLGDWASALENLRTAASADPGQFLVLREKARIERKLSRWDAYYRTLQEAHAALPWDPVNRAELAEAHLYFRDYAAALELARTADDPGSLRWREITAIALADSGDTAAALPLLRALTSGRTPVRPAVYATQAALAQAEQRADEARRLWARFAAASGKGVSEAWDPYRTAERRPAE